MKNSMEQKGLDSAAPSAELPVTEKQCTKCKETKSASEFYKSRKNGFQSQCKHCRKLSKRKTDKAYISDSVPDGSILCSCCGEMKIPNEENFHPCKLKPSSKVLLCKLCHNKSNRKKASESPEKCRRRHKEWRDKNRDHVRGKSREWKANNKDKVRQSYAEYMKNRGGRERRRVYEREYYLKNRDKMIATSCAYDSRVRKSRPGWQKQEEINKYYLEARQSGMEVDHIVPINSEIVCGLHCVDNFQMLTRQENASKGNRYWPDMPEDIE